MKYQNKIILSAVVLTKNEEKHIVDCLESISFCDEIIVIDDNSDDRTKEIAEKMGAKVFTRSLNNNFSQQRNFGLSNTNGEWVLFLDADERVTKELQYEILYVINSSNSDLNGYLVQRKDKMWGKILEHGEVGNIKLLRLAKKNCGKWEGMVHETWNIKGRIGSLKSYIIHYPHENVSEFLKEINFYTTIRANELYQKSIKVKLQDIIVYPLGKFFLNYFIRLGFLDGTAGLVFAIIMSFHSFLVRGKLWQLQNNV